MQQFDIARAQPLETLLETAVEASEPAGPGALGAMAHTLEQQANSNWRQGAGQAVRGKHGKHHREAERCEKVLCGALEKDH
jgi:hypothetical protein